MVTDPPYGVNYDPHWRDEVANDHLHFGPQRAGLVSNDDTPDWSPALAAYKADVLYVWSPSGDHSLHFARQDPRSRA